VESEYVAVSPRLFGPFVTVCDLPLQTQQPAIDGLSLGSLAIGERLQQRGQPIRRQKTLLEIADHDGLPRKVASLLLILTND
jgi:hypothetical protein